MTPAGLPSSITDLRQSITRGELSVAEALRRQHQIIEGDDTWHCVTHRFPLARKLPDKALPLAGVGLAHKDIFHMQGRAPGCGASLPERPSARQASAVSHLDQNGATVLAALAMAEYACGVTGENPNLPTPVNPLCANAAVGGSSSGSAVAVAAELCYGSMGTDTAGSVRIPAATCGIVGFKPGRGVLSSSGVTPLAPSLDTVGILARSPTDAALLFANALDARRRSALLKGTDVQAALSTAAKQLNGKARVATCIHHVDTHVVLREDTRAQIADFVGKLTPDSEEIQLPGMAASSHHASITLMAEACAQHLGHLDANPPLGRSVRTLVLSGAAMPHAWVVRALGERSALARSFIGQVFGRADFLITPVLPQGVPDWPSVMTSSAHFKARALLDLFAWTAFVNYLDLPAIVLPIGSDARHRPVSVQIVAKPKDELRLLAFSILATKALKHFP